MVTQELQKLDLSGPDNSPAVRANAGHVRSRALVIWRWFAIAGQLTAVILVRFGLDYDFPALWCLAAIAVSILVNIIVIISYPSTKLLTDFEASIYLAFDIIQLTFLLFLTGGIQNPFALLFLAPITISASRLTLRSTLALGSLAVICVTWIAIDHLPLPWIESEALSFPVIYLAGMWSALLLGIGFTSAYAWRLANDAARMAQALSTTQLVLAREQRLSALGSLAAAAAHELGTPLATIQLTARELEREVAKDSPLYEDLALISSQAARCRDILRELSRNPEDGDTMVLRQKISTLLSHLADHHRGMGVEIELDCAGDGAPEPEIWRRPEIVHGLSSIFENAVDFARARVAIIARWDAHHITVSVFDDGPGFAPDILTRLGEPYVTSRPQSGRKRNEPASESDLSAGGLGLGFFIAKTLLERTGGTVTFRNHNRMGPGGGELPDPEFLSGAIVSVKWQRASVEVLPIEAEKA